MRFQNRDVSRRTWFLAAAVLGSLLIGGPSRAEVSSEPEWSEDPQLADDLPEAVEPTLDARLPTKEAKPADQRAPQLALPKDLAKKIIPIPPPSPLVPVNKSGLRPEVLKLPEGSGSVQGMGLTFDTSLQTGAASMRLPLSLPPGRRGFAPGLALGYSSGGGQGIAGLGWSLETGFIARQTDQGLPTYGAYDRFVYNGGQELVRVASFGAEVPPDLQGAWIYRAKLEGLFWRLFRVDPLGPDEHWVAQDRDGTRYEFGVEPGARVASGDRVFRWNLVRVTDVHGNEIYYQWEQFAASPWNSAQSYLTHLYWNNHATLSKFQHHVELEYETREDTLRTYAPGFPVVTDRRLASVWVWTDYGGAVTAETDAEGRSRVRRYVLDYDATQYHSLLTSVQLLGRDDTSTLPPAEFTYQEITGSVSVTGLGALNDEVHQLTDSPDASLGTGLQDIVDLDGDGLVDLLLVDPSTFGDDAHRFILGGGTVDAQGRVVPRLPNAPVQMGEAGWSDDQVQSRGDHLALTNSNVQLLDVDGDGAIELVHMPRAGLYQIYKVTCTGTTGSKACRWSKIAEVTGHPSIDLTVDAERIRLLDVNGDHLVDVVRTAGTRMEHWLNLGRYQGGQGRFGHVEPDGSLSDEPVTSCLLYKGGYIWFDDPRVKLADMNGDGLTDIVLVDYGMVAWWPNKGWGQWGEGGACTEGMTGSGREITMTNPPYPAGFNASEIHLGDVNGDGLTDVMRVRATVVDAWLSLGTRFTDRVMISSPFNNPFTNRVRLADVNGSGSRDVLWGDAGQYRYIDFTGGIKPRILVHVDNGLGGTTDITYRTSVSDYVEAQGTATPWTSTCPFPSHVVKEVRSSDQFQQVPGFSEGVVTKRYRYRDCYYDGVEHEFRGYAQAEVETVGDANSPTSLERHYFYQGRNEDEAVAGRAYRVDTLTQASGSDVYNSTSWTSYAVRALAETLPEDAEPGLQEAFWRSVRFAYAAETHSFGYDTTEYQAGPHDRELLSLRSEASGGTVPTEQRLTVSLPASATKTTYLKSDVVVDDLGQPLVSRAYGRVGQDDPIEKRATYVSNPRQWIHRPCETWVESGGKTYQRKLEHYDGRSSTWSGVECQGGGATCEIGEKGLSTRGEYEECYESERVRIAEEHVTAYTAWGQPRHTRSFKKAEEWLYYEDVAGYQAQPTREVMRVGTAAAQVDYPETPVKYLTTRATHDPGLGAITEYRDANDQKSQAVYDGLGRLVELWGPREPSATCPETFMQVAEIVYDLATETRPYSFVHATTFEDACDPSVVKEAWSYVDGLGRTRVTVTEGEANPTGEQAEWIATGFVRFDAKGAARESYAPAFVAWQPSDPPPVLAPNCPASDDFECTRNIICPTLTRYDAFGRAVEQVLGDGTVTRTEYRGPLETWGYDGNDTDGGSLFYGTPNKSRKDGHGRVVEVEATYRDATGGNEAPHFTGYEFDPLGNLVALSTCATGERAATCPGEAIVKEQAFDSLGQRREIRDPDAGTWKFEFDEGGNLVESTDGKWNLSGPTEGNRIGYVYDAADRLILERCLKCKGKPDGTVLVRYFYDSPARMVGGRGYLPEDIEAGGEPQDWVLGRLARVEDETGVVFQSYDRLGRQVTEVQRIEVTLPDDGEVGGPRPYYIGRIAYDAAGRVIRQTYPAAEADQVLEVERSYERRGLLSRIHGPDPLNQGASYDYLVVSTHNAAGQRCGYRYGDASQITATRTYDRLGRLRTAVATQLGASQYPLQAFRYEYDHASNVTKIFDERLAADVEEYTGGKNGVHNRELLYDSLYRLVKAIYSGPNGLRREMSYGYNAIGNLTERSTRNAVGEVNPGGEFYEKWLGPMSYDPARPHAFASAGSLSGSRSVNASYDDNGNMTSLEVRNADENRNVRFEYDWDHYDRLIEARKLDSGVLAARAVYVYDHAGQRVVKAEYRDGTDRQDTLYVTEGFEVRNFQYERFVFDGRQRIARIGVAKPYEGVGEVSRFVYVGDHLGSTSVVVRDEGGVDAGCVVATTSHLPYGGVEAESGAELCDGAEGEEWYRFTGKELEGEFGISYFGARYYNPSLGGFLSVDPSRLFRNTEDHYYLYVNGRVYVAIDPDGRNLFIAEVQGRVRYENHGETQTVVIPTPDGGSIVKTKDDNGRDVIVQCPPPSKQEPRATMRARTGPDNPQFRATDIREETNADKLARAQFGPGGDPYSGEVVKNKLARDALKRGSEAATDAIASAGISRLVPGGGIVIRAKKGAADKPRGPGGAVKHKPGRGHDRKSQVKHKQRTSERLHKKRDEAAAQRQEYQKRYDNLPENAKKLFKDFDDFIISEKNNGR